MTDQNSINEDFFTQIENYLFSKPMDTQNKLDFREKIQYGFTSEVLSKELPDKNKKLQKTKLFDDLYQRYIFNLKEKSLEPFIGNKNLRRAIKDQNNEKFKTYNKKIRDDVNYLISNLIEKYNYSKQGACKICIYVLDNNLAEKYNV